MNKINIYKAIILMFLLSFGMNLHADEGMWVPMLIGKNYQQMKKQGFKLTPQDLYSVNKASLKDAIALFGSGCTAELVSAQGLLFTNHHCGYDAIASQSSPGSNILDNGFWAKSYDMEKPIPGLAVSFLIRMEDVSDQMLKAVSGLDASARAAKLEQEGKRIAQEAVKGTGYEAYVKDFYKGNQYLLCVFEIYTDVRLVGTPPQSIGKFGGDTDNWMWPRHTGDFSVFRVYAGEGNKPAAYSASNKPLKPRKFLPVSVRGIENNDFTMIYGFPGRTDRFLSSYGVKLATDKVSPTIVRLRDIRLKAWKQEMDKDVALRLKLSSKYASVANYWKYFIGQAAQLKKLKIYEKKLAEEQEFTQWAASRPEYAGLPERYRLVYGKYEDQAVHRTYINEGFMASGWVNQALSATAATINALNKNIPGVKEKVQENLQKYEDTYNEKADKKIFAQIHAAFVKDVPLAQHPPFIREILSKYGSSDPEAAFSKYADYLWENSALIRPEKLRAFYSKSGVSLESDPGYQYANNLRTADYLPKYLPGASEFDKAKAELDHLYLKALLEKNQGRVMYPDANSTLRISYGNVQDYSPRDAVQYKAFSTMDGMMEKYIAGDHEFDLPTELVEAWKRKDFGRYGHKGTLPINFISNNDITGGNSGSPVINGKGELIGLAFDGNWEAMSGDIAFDSNYKRTICVDIRYVLWCIDVLGGAKNIISELNIR